MDHNRLLELALEELNRQKAQIEADIESLMAEMRSSSPAVPVMRRGRKRNPVERRPKTETQKKAISEGMKKAWKRRKAAAVAKKGKGR